MVCQDERSDTHQKRNKLSRNNSAGAAHDREMFHSLKYDSNLFLTCCTLAERWKIQFRAIYSLYDLAENSPTKTAVHFKAAGLCYQHQITASCHKQNHPIEKAARVMAHSGKNNKNNEKQILENSKLGSMVQKQ
ncbi:hypothetical protein CEXT_482021 [Caerostris extrusa]|uniref:Uncharacterized protein n=1 Tax=Caerostris extrusa TaxID=172846 RepID=A0AAV4MQV6_CAEEX|nr:hypothetical protein CEXT_482021 [Caerostris extrusa]